jgi:hypothetical protein
MVLKSNGGKYKPLKNFNEAIKQDNSYMIMEGDWGGQIYLVIPVKLVKCSRDAIEKLLIELDTIAWQVNEGDGKGIYFEIMERDTLVLGGMGGGRAKDGLWVHKNFENIRSKIQDVIDNKTVTIS